MGCPPKHALTAFPRLLLKGLATAAGGRRHRQRLAARLDIVFLAVRVNQIHPHLGLRSSAAWAKKAAASCKVSWARLRAQCARAGAFMRFDCSLVTPGLAPVSTAILLSHEGKVSGVQSILVAIDCIAAQRELCSGSLASARPMARSCTSGAYPGRLFIS